MMKKIFEFIKRETVLSAAVVLAVLSAFIIPPDKEYLTYIDFRTLAILFCLMTVMAGLKEIGVFRILAQGLLKRVKSAAQVVVILVLLCFFFSMLITNDVALITFVPFTFIVLDSFGEKEKGRLMVPVVVLQTVAANLGSMLTPIGNPQNLYLYGKSVISLGSFLLLMLPYTAVSLGMLLIWSFWIGRNKNSGMTLEFSKPEEPAKNGMLAFYLILFGICLLSVARILPYGITLLLVLVTVMFADRGVFKKVDYALLLTFIGFFVFIGNMGRVPVFYRFLENIMKGREVLTSVAVSQIISNVPAALLLSGFTDRTEALIVGTNLGGLGTLIASMASLISFKYIVREVKDVRKKYILYFTVTNVLFLAVLIFINIICSGL